MYFSYKNVRVVRNRDDAIIEFCRGRRILHIGAADSPYTREKFANNLLLHKQLNAVATELLGIDLDASAVDWLNDQGLRNIRIMDMNDIASLDFKPDVIVFGETIEHVVNIGTCLDNLKACMGPETKLIISTPNCYHLWFSSMVLRNHESIHDDHKVGFSYGLLWQLLKSQGLAIDDFYFTFLPRISTPWWRQAWLWIAKIRPGFAETLLAVCRIDGADKITDNRHEGGSHLPQLSFK